MANFTKIPVSLTVQDDVVISPIRVHARSEAFLLTEAAHLKLTQDEQFGSGEMVVGFTQKVPVTPGQAEIRFQNVPPGSWFVYLLTGVATV